MTSQKANHPLKPERVLLVVTAHPDDETFGMGGTLALYARRGVEVHLICATRGELGEARSGNMNGNATVAEMRVAELHCAARVLGLSAVHLLDYRDSGMANTPDNTHPQALAAQPVNKVADEISHYIRLLKPQVVMTFDPIGGYHHPDHIAIHRATVAAFHATTGELGVAQKAGKPVWRPAKLYFHLMPHGFLRMAVKLLPLLGKDPRKFGSNKDIDLTVIAESRFPIHAKIDIHDYVHLQDEASACHASQGGREMASGIQAWLSRIFRREDQYMRDYPVPYPGEPIEKDLFQGL